MDLTVSMPWDDKPQLRSVEMTWTRNTCIMGPGQVKDCTKRSPYGGFDYSVTRELSYINIGQYEDFDFFHQDLPVSSPNLSPKYEDLKWQVANVDLDEQKHVITSLTLKVKSAGQE
jgi:hypothetical protein